MSQEKKYLHILDVQWADEDQLEFDHPALLEWPLRSWIPSALQVVMKNEPCACSFDHWGALLWSPWQKVQTRGRSVTRYPQLDENQSKVFLVLKILLKTSFYLLAKGFITSYKSNFGVKL